MRPRWDADCSYGRSSAEGDGARPAAPSSVWKSVMRRFLYRSSLAGPSKSSVPHRSIVIASIFTGSTLEVRRSLLEVGVRTLARLVGCVRSGERVDPVAHRGREICLAPADDQ